MKLELQRGTFFRCSFWSCARNCDRMEMEARFKACWQEYQRLGSAAPHGSTLGSGLGGHAIYLEPKGSPFWAARLSGVLTLLHLEQLRCQRARERRRGATDSWGVCVRGAKQRPTRVERGETREERPAEVDDELSLETPSQHIKQVTGELWRRHECRMNTHPMWEQVGGEGDQ
ncbi:hypothetical protein GQ54DRAFT_11484 [Martensiomyces pterosporus]|nr:hypothetical protein GQ54DRAFT_11484 [Martensiomyces pterosporus]